MLLAGAEARYASTCRNADDAIGWLSSINAASSARQHASRQGAPEARRIMLKANIR